MKRGILIITAILILAGGFWYWDHHPAYQKKFDDLTQSLSQSGVVQDIQKQILTSSPLRSSENAPGAFLTTAGVVSQTNLQRTQNQQQTLKENSLLDRAAKNKLDDMFKNQYFEHISPAGKGPGDLAQQVHYDYIAIGENLALGNFKDDQALVEAWMNSPGHRANILNSKFTEIGVAVGKGQFEGKTVWLAVQEFGKPASACPEVDQNLKIQIDSYKAELSILQTQVNASKSELESSSPKTKKEIDDYNQKVSDYNSLVGIYNNKLDILKQTINSYNSQVSQYNQCAAS